ncbi:hypothetical protein SK128_023923 [Halocaridina rubra]|uniref:Ionotropic glutamate receptor L-glutamate and glycine-binding domain-containing protein n=1 Tax=Halocaridina rubra TaxID=373956 RepID=A0AAN8WDM7_HALRR
MSSCSILLVHDDPQLLKEAMSIMDRYHIYGISLIDLTDQTSSKIIIWKDSSIFSDALVCRGLIVLVKETSWNKLMDMGLDVWAGDDHIFFIILPEDNSQIDAVSLLSDPVLRFSVYIVGAVKQSSSWTLFTNALFRGPSRQIVFPFNSWSPARGFRKTQLFFPPEKMKSLQGYDFAVAALPYSPFIITVNESLRGPGKYRGLEVMLLDVLALAANFTYHYVAPKDGEWGRLTANGTWTGMIVALAIPHIKCGCLCLGLVELKFSYRQSYARYVSRLIMSGNNCTVHMVLSVE